MAKIKYLNFLLSVLILLSFGGCQDGDFEWDYHELEVIVVDENGFPMKDAEVTLYYTETDFQEARNPVQEPKFTDENGVVLFDKLDLQITEYYVEATKGDANNWGKDPKISRFVQFERRKKVIFTENEPLANYLAGRGEKKWNLEYTLINTTRYEGCETYTFNRDKRVYYSFYNVPYNCSPEHLSGEFQFWNLNELGNSFRIFADEQGGTLFEEAQILEQTENTLIYRYKPANNPDFQFFITRKLRLIE